MKLAVLFCIFCMFAVYSAQSAPLYRWVDAEGKVHYTDQPPPASARKIEEKQLNVQPPDNDSLPYAIRMAAKNFPVTLYNSGCGEACTSAREHLIKRGIPFSEKDAGTPDVQTELKKLVGSVEVPVLAVGRIIRLKGYEASAWDAALDEAGYPRSAPALKLKPNAPAKTEAKGNEPSPAAGSK
ncbi:MAG TPA: glutaredoxin family protein [Sulfuricella sp.]|nr:glutaredoxin family protein [Sulfuricella sp.]